jgi:hypothetical protein
MVTITKPAASFCQKKGEKQKYFILFSRAVVELYVVRGLVATGEKGEKSIHDEISKLWS